MIPRLCFLLLFLLEAIVPQCPVFAFDYRSFAFARTATSTAKTKCMMVFSDFQQAFDGETMYGVNGQPLIVGVAGGSGGGKTTLVNEIVKRLGPTEIECISHDSYYRDLNHLSIEERALTNFDHPSSLDSNLLVSHLKQLKDGRSADVPIYDFTTHSRTFRTNTAYPKRIIIVDGILIFSVDELIDLMDLKIFVDCEDDIRLLRRIRRDTTERARSVESVLSQYESCVKPMYDLFVEPTRDKADIIIPTTSNGIKNAALDMVISHMRSVINSNTNTNTNSEQGYNHMNSGHYLQ